MKTNLEYFVYLKRGKKDAWDCNIDSFCNLLSDELKHKLLEQDKIRECKRANLGLNDSRMLFRGDLVDDCTIFNFSRSQVLVAAKLKSFRSFNLWFWCRMYQSS